MKFIVIGKKAETSLIISYPKVTGALLTPIQEFVKRKSCVIENVNIEDMENPIVTIRIPREHPVEEDFVLTSLVISIVKYIDEYKARELNLFES